MQWRSRLRLVAVPQKSSQGVVPFVGVERDTSLDEEEERYQEGKTSDEDSRRAAISAKDVRDG